MQIIMSPDLINEYDKCFSTFHKALNRSFRCFQSNQITKNVIMLNEFTLNYVLFNEDIIIFEGNDINV